MATVKRKGENKMKLGEYQKSILLLIAKHDAKIVRVFEYSKLKSSLHLDHDGDIIGVRQVTVNRLIELGLLQENKYMSTMQPDTDIYHITATEKVNEVLVIIH